MRTRRSLVMHDERLAEEASRVRRQNRWLKRALTVAMVTLPVLFMMRGGTSQGSQKEIVAESFVVMSGTHVRARLSLEDDGRVGLRLNDQAGKQRVIVGVFPGGEPTVAMFGDDGTRRLDLTIASSGGWIRFMDRNGRIRVGMVIKDGFGAIDILDESGKTTWRAP
jgi:hypothetical protein